MGVSARGRGFDPARCEFGMGLANMTERAQLVGGSFQVVSAPGEGTRTLLRVPVHSCS
jgi:signal transduction histidine kinase